MRLLFTFVLVLVCLVSSGQHHHDIVEDIIYESVFDGIYFNDDLSEEFMILYFLSEGSNVESPTLDNVIYYDDNNYLDLIVLFKILENEINNRD